MIFDMLFSFDKNLILVGMWLNTASKKERLRKAYI